MRFGGPAGDDGLARAEHRLRLDALLAGADALNDRQREVLALRFAADLPAAEIARQLGLSEANVHQISSRALRREAGSRPPCKSAIVTRQLGRRCMRPLVGGRTFDVRARRRPDGIEVWFDQGIVSLRPPSDDETRAVVDALGVHPYGDATVASPGGRDVQHTRGSARSVPAGRTQCPVSRNAASLPRAARRPRIATAATDPRLGVAQICSPIIPIAWRLTSST